MFGEAEATYKVPNSINGIVAVLASIIQDSVEKGFVDKDTASDLINSIKRIAKGKG